jgi:hypothetical protein
MGKTYRHLPDKCIRHPKGHKQAKINKARHKAVPPSAWDDEQYNNECWRPLRIAKKMKDQGFSWEEIRSRVVEKFNLNSHEVQQVRESL